MYIASQPVVGGASAGRTKTSVSPSGKCCSSSGGRSRRMRRLGGWMDNRTTGRVDMTNAFCRRYHAASCAHNSRCPMAAMAMVRSSRLSRLGSSGSIARKRRMICGDSAFKSGSSIFVMYLLTYTMTPYGLAMYCTSKLARHATNIMTLYVLVH